MASTDAPPAGITPEPPWGVKGGGEECVGDGWIQINEMWSEIKRPRERSGGAGLRFTFRSHQNLCAGGRRLRLGTADVHAGHGRGNEPVATCRPVSTKVLSPTRGCEDSGAPPAAGPSSCSGSERRAAVGPPCPPVASRGLLPLQEPDDLRRPAVLLVQSDLRKLTFCGPGGQRRCCLLAGSSERRLTEERKAAATGGRRKQPNLDRLQTGETSRTLQKPPCGPSLGGALGYLVPDEASRSHLCGGATQLTSVAQRCSKDPMLKLVPMTSSGKVWACRRGGAEGCCQTGPTAGNSCFL